jgi:hypothetical protein
MSKIEVNAIEPQCGTTLTVGAAGTTVTVPSNVVKSNALQASDAGNIISQSGTTITLGATGDSINLASGATQSGFGRTGTVDWDTTPKTATFTAVNGTGYFVNTTAGVITVNLPAGSAGAIVGISDYASTFQTNNITITPNGAEKINGVNDDAILSTQGIAVSLVYVDATRGWKSVTGSDNDTTGVIPSAFVVATGGTITCSGDYKIHTFTGPGTFCVSEAGTPLGSNTVDYLVVAGGGSGGGRYGGGGGGGGYRESSGAASGSYTRSPLGACVAALAVPATSYPITVGGGGAAVPAIPGSNAGNVGSVSTFSSITSAGGGGGGGQGNNGVAGGNGGGGSYNGSGGAGNTPPVSPAQGASGGNGHPIAGAPYATGGGGGATEAGQNSVPSPSTAGRGGAGATSCISASPVGRSGGGGGSGEDASGPSVIAGAGSPCGSGTSGAGSISPAPNAAANRGGGSGAAYFTNGSPEPGLGNSGVGGSGIVIVRYKFQ